MQNSKLPRGPHIKEFTPECPTCKGSGLRGEFPMQMRKARIDLGVSLAELGKYAGCSREHIHKIEQSRIDPGVCGPLIAEFLGIESHGDHPEARDGTQADTTHSESL